MALEHRGRDEGLLTQVTLVLLVSVVHHLDVHVERVLPLEGGVALVALERPLACVTTTKERKKNMYCIPTKHPQVAIFFLAPASIVAAQREGELHSGPG